MNKKLIEKTYDAIYKIMYANSRNIENIISDIKIIKEMLSKILDNQQSYKNKAGPEDGKEVVRDKLLPPPPSYPPSYPPSCLPFINPYITPAPITPITPITGTASGPTTPSYICYISYYYDPFFRTYSYTLNHPFYNITWSYNPFNINNIKNNDKNEDVNNNDKDEDEE